MVARMLRSVLSTQFSLRIWPTEMSKQIRLWNRRLLAIFRTRGYDLGNVRYKVSNKATFVAGVDLLVAVEAWLQASSEVML